MDQFCSFLECLKEKGIHIKYLLTLLAIFSLTVIALFVAYDFISK